MYAFARCREEGLPLANSLQTKEGVDGWTQWGRLEKCQAAD